MVEVFKTNVDNRLIADQLLAQLHENIAGCKANFDLDDCDLILRVQYPDDVFIIAVVISTIEKNGFTASILADELS